MNIGGGTLFLSKSFHQISAGPQKVEIDILKKISIINLNRRDWLTPQDL